MPRSPERVRPTRRPNNRYVEYRAINGNDRDVLTGLTRLIGELGMGEAGVMTISYDPRTRTGILKTTTQHYGRIRAAMTLLPLHVLKTSGTLKTLKR